MPGWPLCMSSVPRRGSAGLCRSQFQWFECQTSQPHSRCEGGRLHQDQIVSRCRDQVWQHVPGSDEKDFLTFIEIQAEEVDLDEAKIIEVVKTGQNPVMKFPHTTGLDLAQFIKEEEQVFEFETTVVIDSNMRLQYFQQQSKLMPPPSPQLWNSIMPSKQNGF